MDFRAIGKYIRVSPRKTRLVADLIRDKNVGEALNILSLVNKKPAGILKKVLRSAIFNAEQKKVADTDLLKVKTIHIDQGPTWKRFMPRARGSSTSIKKRTSHISIIIGN